MGYYSGTGPVVGNKLYGDLDLNGYDITGAGVLVGGISTIDTSSATYNLSSADAYGKLFQMTKSDGGQTVNLPACSAGMMVTIMATQAQIITINPDDADRIIFGATTKADGATIACAAQVGAQITLYCDSVNGWTVLGYVGVWA